MRVLKALNLVISPIVCGFLISKLAERQPLVPAIMVVHVTAWHHGRFQLTQIQCVIVMLLERLMIALGKLVYAQQQGLYIIKPQKVVPV
jgi:uncharacterized membrane protein YjdF